MRVLWIVNITMPDACEALQQPAPVVGGWLTGYRDALQKAFPEIELHIIEPYNGSMPKEIESSMPTAQRTKHHLFPQSWLDAYKPLKSGLSPFSNQLSAWLMEVNEEVKPDAVHLHGTEYPHSLAWAEACGTSNVVVSIQGLTSVYAQYYMAGLTPKEQRPTFNDLRFHRSLAQLQQQLAERGKSEELLLKKVQHVAGRTSWDRTHAWALNPALHYHTLQEVLRNEFYDIDRSWNLKECQRHSIFVSQGHYPIKGLHKMLEAMPFILREYPDAELYVVGKDPTTQTWSQRSAFTNVIRERIAPVREHVHYLGFLSAHQMVEQYKKANVFVCPSAIENSSNSVCEAQLIGCPVVASYVGGLMDLVEDGQTGLLYRFEETSMLAEEVCRIFANDDLATKIGEQARQTATLRHDRNVIAGTLYNIYTELTHGS